MQQYDAVILAGGVNSGALRKYAPYESEALIIIGAYPMIYYAYRALRQSARIGRIIISGPVESLRELFKKEENIVFAHSGADAIDSFSNAVEAVGIDNLSEKVVVMPTDIPFITAEAIENFLDKCEAIEGDFYYPLVSKEVNEARFPGVKRTYVKLREGIFTGGNLFLVRTAVLHQSIDIAKKLVAKRKSPMAIARLFGPKMMIKFVTRRLSIRDAQERFHEVVGLAGVGVISDYAEIGVDVDKPSDLKLAEQVLANLRF